MKRRKALMLTAGIMGSTIIGSDIFLSGCAREVKNNELFSETDIALLDEVGETILPKTDRSPGAKSAKVGLFMKVIVTDCYDEEEQAIFKSGISVLNKMGQDRYSSTFIKLTKKQKHDLLVELDKEAKAVAEKEPSHFFSMIKQLTIWGFFTSKPGATEALRYNPVPGKFKGCIPYIKGDKAWA
jgi:hypothetical protein